MTMLALKNEYQEVHAAVPGLARAANVSVEKTEVALSKFLSADPHSRTKENDGRRIREIPGGWLILNGDFYKRLMSIEERREYKRLKEAERRERLRGQSVDKSGQTVARRGRKKAYTETDTETETEVHTTSAAAVPSPHGGFIQAWGQAYKAKFGYEYAFDGGRDGKAVKALLQINVPTSEVLEIATLAWDRSVKPPRAFGCEQASTIHGFQEQFNKIRAELKNEPHRQSNRLGPERNAGTAHNDAEYRVAAAAKLARADADREAAAARKRAMDSQVVKP